MATHDYDIANGSGQAVRLDINNVLDAIRSSNSSQVQPSGTPVLGQIWYDTSSNELKVYKSSGWQAVGGTASGALIGSGSSKLEVTAGSAGTTSIYPAGDTDSGFFFRQGSQASYGYGFSYSIAGTEWLSVDAQITGDNSSPSWNWRSRNVSISSNTANDAGVQMTQSGRTVIQKDAGWILGLNRTTSNGDVVLIAGQGTTRGTISVTSSSVSYNTSSDYRLKENVVNLTGAKSRLQQLLPKRFNFIGTSDQTVDGFIAHETQTIVPESITGTKDEVDSDGSAVYQGIDQSKLVPLLTAALQEAFAEIASLTTRVATLEAN